MTAIGSLEYAHARLWARYGARPDDAAWRRVEHARELAGLVDVARASAFRHWITGIDATATPHRIEAALRDRWRDLVFEVASWMPDEWQAAVRWCAVVVDLPAIQHLARAGTALPWMRDEPIYRNLIGPKTGYSGAAPVAGPLAPLAAAWADPDRTARAWRDEWQRRLPRRADDEDSLAELPSRSALRHSPVGRPGGVIESPSRSALRHSPLGRPGGLMHALERELASHWRALHDPSLGDGVALRRALQARLALLFRRAMHDPAAAFIFLTQIALDLERLRGELVRRAAFPGLPLAGAA